MLLDEPFSALDRKLRETMQIDLRHILREVGITTVLVTHDQEEALVMSDRIAVMSKGAIEQFDTPEGIYTRPRTPFALGFVGHSTRIYGRAGPSADGIMAVDTTLGQLRAKGNFVPGSKVLLGVRPERIGIGAASQGSDMNTLTAALTDVVFQGSKVHLHFMAGETPVLVETNRIPEGMAPGVETPLSWAVADTLLFPDDRS
jgi:putative spermidine/putrescine transport system ATP-binding protein